MARGAAPVQWKRGFAGAQSFGRRSMKRSVSFGLRRTWWSMAVMLLVVDCSRPGATGAPAPAVTPAPTPAPTKPATVDPALANNRTMGPALPTRLSDAEFWKLENDISEPGGYFQIE